jgi:SAM-dependent methyltransferase
MNNINLDFYDKTDFIPYEILKDDNIVKYIKQYTSEESYPIEFDFIFNKNASNTLKFCEINKDALIVNDCFGQKTKYLCQNCNTVTDIEFSLTSAEIVHSKIKDFGNCEIVVGKLQKIELNKKFDYIILSNLLEFSQVLIEHEKNPFKKLLMHFKKLLKPNGTLILEESNPFGIRNWIGELDFYTNTPFVNLLNYKDINNIRILSKKDLLCLFKDAGFQNANFYYPIPTNYNATKILKDNYKIDNYIEDKIINTLKEDALNKHNLYSIENITREIIKNNKFDFFANSFLIILEDNPQLKNKNFEEFSKNINTKLIKKSSHSKYLVKEAITQNAEKYLNSCYNFYLNEKERLKKNKIKEIKLVKCKQENNTYTFDYIEGKTLQSIAMNFIKHNDEEGIANILIEFYNIILKLYPSSEIMDFRTENLMANLFGYCEILNTQCIKNFNPNLNFKNIIKHKNLYYIANYENFSFGYIPLKYIIASPIFKLSIDCGINYKNCLNILGFLPKEIEIYKSMFSAFEQKRGFENE